MQFHRSCSFYVLLGLSLNASALTIGRPQGSAWIGKPLSIGIPLTLDSADDAARLCLQAEVSQADVRIDETRLRVSLEPGTGAGNFLAMIRSSVVIEEPVVSVVLNAGCDARSTRRFVMLADLPPAGALAPSLPIAGAADGANGRARNGAGSIAEARRRSGDPTGARRSGSTSTRSRAGGEAPGALGSGPAPDPTPRATRAAASSPLGRDARARADAAASVTRRRADAVAATPPPAATSPGPRLQVDPFELAPATEARLRAVSRIATPLLEDPAKRAEAARLGRIQTATPEEFDREAQRLQALETTLATLRQQTGAQERSLLDLRRDLASSQQSGFPMAWVYALLGLMLLMLVGLLLLWRRSRQSAGQWWTADESLAPDAPGPERSEAAPVGAVKTVPPEPAEPELDPEQLHTRPVVMDMSRAPLSGPAPLSGARFDASQDDDADRDDAFEPGEDDWSHEGDPDQRSIDTEALFDVQQESDFFVSIGQYDQAIALLAEHITLHPRTSALAYLDLLKIYQAQNMRGDFEQLRRRFSRMFHVEPAAFEQFGQSGKGLEQHPDALRRLESQWPRGSTLPLIEELMFRRPVPMSDDNYDLPAYQDLLLLYAIAKEVAPPQNGISLDQE
ncbi:MAG: hypothetical protein EOO22_01115, partial [Comamonadaceae bacterium]